MNSLPFLTAILLAAGAAVAEPGLERGAYLVQGPMGCGNCHTPLGPEGPMMDMDLAGRVVEDTPAYTAIAANITPGGNVAGWSDMEVGRAVRECLRPDGTLIGPPMPCALYRTISDDDLASIVMYLRTVPTVEHDPGQSVYNIPLPPAYGPTIDSVAAPEPGPTVEYGQYVANLAHCMECHSAVGPTGAPALDVDHLGAGGFEFHGPWGVVAAPNITSHDDGISGVDDTALKAMITKGMRGDQPMLPPMPYPYLAVMTEQDLGALVLYLRSVAPLPNPG